MKQVMLEFLSWTGFLLTLALLSGGLIGMFLKLVERLVNGPRGRT